MNTFKAVAAAVVATVILALSSSAFGQAHAIDRSDISSQTLSSLWRGSGPYGGVIFDIAIASSATVYAGTLGGGVFKTTTAGLSWSSTGLSSVDVYSIAIDPVKPSILYAGSKGQILKSTDGAVTWTRTAASLPDVPVYTITIDPRTSSTVYAGAGRGLWKSTDAGATWVLLDTGLTSARISKMVIDPTSSSVVYVATAGIGVLRSMDGGNTWQTINKGLPESSYASALVVDPTNPNVVYAGVAGWIFKTTDGGSTWTSAGAAPSSYASYAVYALTIDPAVPTTVYAAAWDGQAGTVFKSTNGGEKWAVLATGIPTDAACLDLEVHPADPGVIYAGTGAGVFKTTSAGDDEVRCFPRRPACDH